MQVPMPLYRAAVPHVAQHPGPSASGLSVASPRYCTFGKVCMAVWDADGERIDMCYIENYDKQQCKVMYNEIAKETLGHRMQQRIISQFHTALGGAGVKVFSASSGGVLMVAIVLPASRMKRAKTREITMTIITSCIHEKTLHNCSEAQ